MPTTKVHCTYCRTFVPKGDYRQHETMCKQLKLGPEILYGYAAITFLSPSSTVPPEDSPAVPHDHGHHQKTKSHDALPL